MAVVQRPRRYAVNGQSITVALFRSNHSRASTLLHHLLRLRIQRLTSCQHLHFHHETIELPKTPFALHEIHTFELPQLLSTSYEIRTIELLRPHFTTTLYSLREPHNRADTSTLHSFREIFDRAAETSSSFYGIHIFELLPSCLATLHNLRDPHNRISKTTL